MAVQTAITIRNLKEVIRPHSGHGNFNIDVFKSLVEPQLIMDQVTERIDSSYETILRESIQACKMGTA